MVSKYAMEDGDEDDGDDEDEDAGDEDDLMASCRQNHHYMQQTITICSKPSLRTRE